MKEITTTIFGRIQPDKHTAIWGGTALRDLLIELSDKKSAVTNEVKSPNSSKHPQTNPVKKKGFWSFT